MSHLNFYDRVQPACLPDPFHIHDGDSIAVASGWGTTNPSTVVFQFKQVQFKQDFQFKQGFYSSLNDLMIFEQYILLFLTPCLNQKTNVLQIWD